MSGQRSKKRIGSSRRRVSNQNGKADASDGVHVAESHSVEESIESLTDLTEHSPSGSQYPPLSEDASNRRKLGSSRKMRAGRNFEDSIAESHRETEEEVVENIASSEAVGAVEVASNPLQPQGYVKPDLSTIQLIHSEGTNPEDKFLEHQSTENTEVMTEQKGCSREGSSVFGGNRTVIQKDMILEEKSSTQAQEEIQQGELGHGSEPVLLMSPRLEKSLSSSSVADHFFEFDNHAAANIPGVYRESLIFQSEVVNDPGEDSELKQKEPKFCITEEKYHTSQNDTSDQITSNTHLGAISESAFVLESDLSIEQQPKVMLQPDEAIQSQLSVADVNEERKEAMDLLLQGRNLQANYLASESDVEAEQKDCVKAMISEKNTAIKSVEPDNVIVEQTTITLSAERLSTDRTQIEHISSSQVKDANLLSHNSEDVINNEVQEELEEINTKEVNPIRYMEEELHDTTENVNTFEKTEDGDVETSGTEPPTNKQNISNPENTRDEDPVTQDYSEVLKERNENDMSDSSEPRSSSTERIDSTPEQHGDERQVVDMKIITDSVVHREAVKPPRTVEDDESTLQTLPSDSRVSGDEHFDAFNLMEKAEKMASTCSYLQDRPKQEIVHKGIEEHKETGSHEGVMEDDEAGNGGKSNERDNATDYIKVSNKQSNTAVCANVTGLKSEGVASELNNSILCGDTSDSSLVETCLSDDMALLHSSEWQHGPSSEESQSYSVERSDSLQSTQQDNSVSQEDQKNKVKLRDMGTPPRYPSDHKDKPVQEEPSMLKYVQENRETTRTETSSKPEIENRNLKEDFENRILQSFTKHEESEAMLFNQDDNPTSELQNISHPDETDSTNPRKSPLLKQEVSQSSDIQATKEEIDIKQTLKPIGSLHTLTTTDFIDIGVKCDTEAEVSVGKQVVPKRDEVGKVYGDPAKEDNTPQVMDTLHMVTKSELLPVELNTSVLSNTPDAFDVANEEDLQKETSDPVEQVPEQGGISGVDATNDHMSHPGILNRDDQNKDYDDSANLKSSWKKRKLGSTRRSIYGRGKRGEMDPKDEILEGEISREVDMRSEESLKAKLKLPVEPKSNTSNLHVVSEEREIDQGLAEITSASYLLTNSINQEKNMDIVQMGSDSESYGINLQKDAKVTTEDFYNLSKEVDGGFSVLKDNEVTIDDGHKPTGKMTNSTSGGPLRQKDDEVKEQQRMEVVGKLEVIETAEPLQIKKVETPLNTFYTSDDVLKENERVYQETTENITGQPHDQDSLIAATDQHDVDLESSRTSSISLSEALLPEEVASHNENIDISALLVQENLTHLNRNVEDKVGGFVEPPHSDKVESTEMPIISTAFESDSSPQSHLSPRPPDSEDYKSIDPSTPGRRKKMGSSRKTRRSPQEGEKQSEESKGEQEQGISKAMLLKSEETSGVTEVTFEMLKSNESRGAGEGDEDAQADTGEQNKTSSEADDTQIEITITSQDSNKANRRKFGSSRVNLRWPKEKLLHGKQEAELVTTGKGRDTEHHLTPSFQRSSKSNMEENIIQTLEKERGGPLDPGRHAEAASYDPRGNNPPYNSSVVKDFLSDDTSQEGTSVQLGDQLGHGRDKRSPLDGPKEGELGSRCYNVVIVGSSNVGKTSFMKRIQSGQFCPDFAVSVGIDTCMQSVAVDGKTVMLKIWDTAGQERFHSLTRQLLNKAQAFLLMYDITSFQSFSEVDYWISSIQQGAAESVYILLLGNKSDGAPRQVHSHEGEVLAQEYNIDFMECSAATGENVIHSVETVARVLSQNSDIQEEGMALHKDPPKRKSFGCC